MRRIAADAHRAAHHAVGRPGNVSVRPGQRHDWPGQRRTPDGVDRQRVDEGERLSGHQQEATVPADPRTGECPRNSGPASGSRLRRGLHRHLGTDADAADPLGHDPAAVGTAGSQHPRCRSRPADSRDAASRWGVRLGELDARARAALGAAIGACLVHPCAHLGRPQLVGSLCRGFDTRRLGA
jgi:hypothetical protein